MSALTEEMLITLQRENNRLSRSVETLMDELENKAADEQVYRDLDKAHGIIARAGEWMDRQYGSHFDRLPGAIQELIEGHRKLRGGQEIEKDFIPG